MIYSFGGRVDNDSNAITVIDEENETAVTTGYVNGEYVEFSGGGSSDFSTAEVTLANNLIFSGGVPICSSEDGLEGINVRQLGDGTYTVPLWKGHLYLVLQNITATVSGDAELIYDGVVVDVYGDCTITKVS